MGQELNTSIFPKLPLIIRPMIPGEEDNDPFNYGIEVTGGLDMWKMPDVYIWIEGIERPFKGTIDTGVYWNIISPQLVKQLNTHPKGHKEFRDINKKEDFITRSPNFEFEFRFSGTDLKIKNEFCLHENIKPNYFLIGSSFLSKCKSFLYDGPNDYFEINI